MLPQKRSPAKCGDHRARHPDANVHSLDGYTCQRTPSLMHGPQMKATQQRMTASTAPRQQPTAPTAPTVRQRPTASDSVRHLRQLPRMITAPTAPTPSDTLRQHSDSDSSDSLRQRSDPLRQLRQLRQPGLRLRPGVNVLQLYPEVGQVARAL